MVPSTKIWPQFCFCCSFVGQLCIWLCARALAHSFHEMNSTKNLYENHEIQSLECSEHEKQRAKHIHNSEQKTKIQATMATALRNHASDDTLLGFSLYRATQLSVLRGYVLKRISTNSLWMLILWSWSLSMPPLTLCCFRVQIHTVVCAKNFTHNIHRNEFEMVRWCWFVLAPNLAIHKPVFRWKEYPSGELKWARVRATHRTRVKLEFCSQILRFFTRI